MTLRYKRTSWPGLSHGCPAHFVLYEAHGTESTHAWTLGTFRDTKGDNAVRHQNTVFHTLLKHLPWGEFERLVEAYGADEDERGFTTKTQLVAMIYAQLSGAASLREIAAGLSSHQTRLYHLGIGPVCRSSLADANAHRPSGLFADLFATLVKQARRGLRRKFDDATYLIDATSVALNRRSEHWARFSAEVCGAKVHVVYDPEADQPVYSAFSTANVNDITAAKAMPIEAGATYVFDLGYYDYAWWAKLDAQGCRIVTRFKRNTPLTDAEERYLPQDADILSDRVGFLPKRQANSRKNPFHKKIREVQVRTDSGKILRIATNDLTAPARLIADLYKQRWAIELFFRWVKQTLKITRFVGTSENAIRNSNRRRSYQLSAAALGTGHPKGSNQPTRLCPPRSRQSDAQTRRPRPAPTRSGRSDQSQSAGLAISKNRAGQPWTCSGHPRVAAVTKLLKN